MAPPKTEGRFKLDGLGIEHVERVLHHAGTVKNAARFLEVKPKDVSNFKVIHKKIYNRLRADRENGLLIDESPIPEGYFDRKEKEGETFVESPASIIKRLEEEIENLSESSKTAIKSVERRLEKREAALETKTEELKEARALIDKLQQDKKKTEATHFELSIDYQKLSKKLEKAEAAIEKSTNIRLELVDEVKSLKAAKSEAERKAENALKLKDVALQDEIKKLKQKIEGQQVTINSAAKATQAMREAHAKQIAEQEDIHIEDITNYEKDFKALEAEKQKLEKRIEELESVDRGLVLRNPDTQETLLLNSTKVMPLEDIPDSELEFWRDTAKLYQKQLRELGGL